MADVKWVVDAEFPQGHAVPLTAAEQAQLDADRAANASTAAATAQQDQNGSTIRVQLLDALGNLENAYTNWAALTAAQKDAALRLEVRVTLGLVRLMLRRLDTAGV